MNTKVYLTQAAANNIRVHRSSSKKSNPNPSNFPTIIGIFKTKFSKLTTTFHPKYSFQGLGLQHLDIPPSPSSRLKARLTSPSFRPTRLGLALALALCLVGLTLGLGLLGLLA